MHGDRGTAIVPLPDKTAMFTAERNGRIDALGNPRALKDDIGPLRRDLFHLGLHIAGLTADRVISPQLLGDGLPFLIEIDGQHDATAVCVAAFNPA